jgi:hypothetical protein
LAGLLLLQLRSLILLFLLVPGEFDMRVKSCEASDGVNRPIQLSDEHGCVLRPKMVSKFLKLRSNDGRSTVMSYAFFHAFKFPDSLQVYIRCKVEICRHGCPEHCDKTISRAAEQQLAYTETKASYNPAATAPVPSFVPIPAQQKSSSAYELPPQPLPGRNLPVAPPVAQQQQQYPAQRRNPLPPAREVEPEPQTSSKRPFFGLLGRNKPSSPERSSRPGLFQKKKDNFSPVASAQVAPPPPQAQAQVVDVPIPIPGSQTQDQGLSVALPSPIDRPLEREEKKSEDNKYSERGPGKFPHGPRSLNFDKFE